LGPNAGSQPEGEVAAQRIASAADVIKALWNSIRPPMYSHIHGRPVGGVLTLAALALSMSPREMESLERSGSVVVGR